MSLLGQCPSLLLLLALDGGVEQEVVVERWEGGRPKHTDFYVSEGSRRRLVREITYFTSGKPWVVFEHAASETTRSTYGQHGGELERVAINRSGQPHGTFVRWNDKGGLAAQGHYRDGRRVSLWVDYDSQGLKRGETFYDPPDRRRWARTYFSDGRTQQEWSPSGGYTEYYRDGQPKLRNNGKGKVERFAPGGLRIAEDRVLPDGRTLLWNAWDEHGKPCVSKGNGTRVESNGELGAPVRVRYRGGVAVAREPLPAGTPTADLATATATPTGPAR